MILYYSPTSPFARIARLGIREGDLTAQVEERTALLRNPANAILPHSPMGRVPTLVDGDMAFADTTRVYAWIAHKAGNAAMRPADAADGPAMALEGLVLGLLETLVMLSREARRPDAQQSADTRDQEQERAGRCLARLESAAAAGQLPAFPAFGAVALASTLGYMDFNNRMPGWAERYPGLARWSDTQKARPSMIETAPVRPS